MTAFLIITGVLLIAFNIRAVIKDNRSFNKVLIDKKENIEEYKIDIGKLRKEFAETILDIQKDIQNIDDKVEQLIDEHNEYKHKLIIGNNDNNEESVVIKDKPKEDIIINDNKQNINNIKVVEVDKMLKEGLSIDQIAEKMKIGKGEVLLIKELYIK